MLSTQKTFNTLPIATISAFSFNSREREDKDKVEAAAQVRASSAEHIFTSYEILWSSCVSRPWEIKDFF